MGFQGTPLVRCRSWFRLRARRQMCWLLRLVLRRGHRHLLLHVISTWNASPRKRVTRLSRPLVGHHPLHTALVCNSHAWQTAPVFCEAPLYHSILSPGL